MAKKKFYVVWKGKKTGVFTSWNTCKKQIDGFPNAQYKSFSSKEEAEKAIKGNYEDYKEAIGVPIVPSISVDAACSGNPGKMEYRGVETHSKSQLFIQGPFEKGTNNIGEFLALVHGLGYLKQKKIDLPIYSDSRIAMSWVKKGQCRTNLQLTDENRPLFDMIKRAEKWLKENRYKTTILKWETKAWGEIPADFGRK
ncbi:UNVERIFIED_CONTAM: hypothetical protein GTU68_033916 [Idotea baltica]|nr:hypothetical protein [Idotea baltica]